MNTSLDNNDVAAELERLTDLISIVEDVIGELTYDEPLGRRQICELHTLVHVTMHWAKKVQAEFNAINKLSI